ncbi:MAG TPA: hypothetical protein ENJ09_06660 [Planctomycetes bacterium]|nr:hypothetical protein [Planctomycetota bacterium]
MSRFVLSFALAFLVLAAGIGCALLAATNRAHAARLHERQRTCETLSRQIELRRIANAEAEWALRHGPVEIDESAQPSVPKKVRS